MVLNASFCKSYNPNHFIRQVTMFVENIENRIIPTFNDLENEAKKVEEEELENSYYGITSPDFDPSELVENAHEAGYEYYKIMTGFKQAILNISVVALYHLFEQQSLFFLYEILLEPPEKKINGLLSFLKKRFRRHNIRIGKFSSWLTINELKDVSNAVKHAKGDSEKNLRKIRPEIFTHPLLEKDELKKNSVSYPLSMPLAGEDLYVSEKDIKKYGDSIVSFWNEIISAMDLQNQ